MKKITSWRLWFVVLGCLGAVGLTIYLGNLRAGDVPPAPLEKPLTESRAPAPLPGGAMLIGFADADPGVTALMPLSAGRIVEIPAQEDTAVKKGDVLLRLDDRNVVSKVKQAESALKAARADLEDAKKGPALRQIKIGQQNEAIEAAKANWSGAEDKASRARRLLKSDLITAEESRIAEREVDGAKNQFAIQQKILEQIKLQDPTLDIQKAEAKVSQCENALKEAQDALDDCSLKAPEDGRVLRVLVRVGEVVAPQMRQTSIEFCPDKPRIIRAEVEQEFASRVKVGSKVSVFDDVSQSKPRQGVVKALADYYTPRRNLITDPMPIGNTVPYNDVRTLECKITLNPGQEPFKINQKVRVQVEPSAH